MAGFQSPQDDFGRERDTATPAQAAEPYGQQLNGQSQVLPYVPQQPAPNGRRPYATGLTSAQQVWYTLQCIYFGAGYFAKLPTAKALSEMPVFQTAGYR